LLYSHQAASKELKAASKAAADRARALGGNAPDSAAEAQAALGALRLAAAQPTEGGAEQV
jgi:hypothetical protein